MQVHAGVPWFVLPIGVVAFAAGCTGQSADARASSSAGLAPPERTWSLDNQPIIEVGAVDGDDRYLLHNALDAVRLADGGIAILNAGSHELRFYDATGAHVRSVGHVGKGPGEFTRPRRLHHPHADTLVVWDPGTGLESRFDAHGEFLGAMVWQQPEGESFRRDDWLHGRNVVSGPMMPAARGPVRRVLDALPALETPGAYRRVIVDSRSRVWMRTAPFDDALPGEWELYRSDGAPLARIVTPASFELLDAGDSTPGNQYRYASRADQLEWPEDMQGLIVHILHGSDRGWTMIVLHESERIMCGVSVGDSGPAGWTPGVTTCS